MTPPIDPEALRKSFLRTSHSYGKIGLLIDDAPDAPGRVARALYGCEALPDWWLVARSVTCGLSLLRCCEKALEEERAHFQGVCVIDRYLLVACGTANDGDVVAWDSSPGGAEAALCQEMEQVVRSLLEKQDGGSNGFFLELETSYPHGFRSHDPGIRESPLPWKTRGIDLLYRLRGEIRRARRADLLLFGPGAAKVAEDSYESPEFPREERDEPKWKARCWQATLDELAKALVEQRDHVILFTGAGASLRPSSLACGIPSTYALLEEASRETILLNPTFKLPSKSASTFSNDPRCLCEAKPEPKKEPPQSWDPKGSETPVEWLLNKISRGFPITSLKWHLEYLFSAKRNPKKKLFEQFCNAFRVALHRYDHGFTHHHWLMAQLPWRWVVTTNFDSFHEHAMSHAVLHASAKERDEVLRRGSPMVDYDLDEAPVGETENSPQSDHARQRMRKRRGLLKPYGSLLVASDLGLGAEQIERYQQFFREEVEARLVQAAKAGADSKSKIWLVVIGHAMADPYINKLLEAHEEVFASEATRLLWVDPRAWEIASEADPELHSQSIPTIWNRWMHERLKKGIAGPIPAKANQFVYDLWQAFCQEK